MTEVFWRHDFAGLGADAPSGEYDDFIRRALLGLEHGQTPQDTADRIAEILTAEWGIDLGGDKRAQLAFDIRAAWDHAETAAN